MDGQPKENAVIGGCIISNKDNFSEQALTL